MVLKFINSLMVSALLIASSACQASVYTTNVPQLINKYGYKAELRLNHVNEIIKNYSDAATIEKLTEINNYFNLFAYVSDINLWSRVDYWATTLEFIGAGSGDCEDYALAKYQTLKKMGISNKHLKLEYVKVIPTNEAHLVLNYYETPTSDPLVLDNYNKEILPASQRFDLTPFFVFNTHGFKFVKNRKYSYSEISNIQSEWNSYLKRTTLRKPNFNIYNL